MDNILKSLKRLAIPIDSVKLDERNARQHPPGNLDAIRRSLEHYGQRKPIVIRQEDMSIEAGNGLWMAAKELGWTHIAAVMVEDDPTEATGYAIMDNQSALLADWDFPILKDLLEELDTGSFDMNLTGFTSDAIEELMTQFHVPEEGLTDDDAIPEKVESICKTGDLWQLGSHRLLVGDATVITDVERLMGGEKADLVFTDPPYNIDLGHIGHSFNNYDDSKPMHLYEGMLQAVFSNALPFCGDTPFYVFSSNRDVALIQALLTSLGLTYHQLLVWAKHSGMLGNSDYIQNYEVLHYAYLGKHRKVFSKGLLACDLIGLEENFETIKHPTSKPVALLNKFIKNHSQVNNTVLDLFGGSGSTLIACEKLGRRCFMMEIDEHYCDVIVKRWEDYTGKKAKL